MQSKSNYKAYLLILTLLFFSGNPLATFLFGKFSVLVGFLFIVIILNKDFKIERKFLQKFRLAILGILFITFSQYLILPMVSTLAIANLLFKLFLGGFIIWHLKELFPFLLFRVLGYLSIISIIFFVSVNYLGNSLPHIKIAPDVNSYLIYNLPIGHLTRNSGMFWEPGAFAGILTLGLALNLNSLQYYWNKHKILLSSIILALISSQSTTGYLVSFLILIFVFLKPRHFGISLALMPLLISGAIYVYETNDFLKEKINSQFEKSKSQEVGDFSNTRFGSIIFDWHYIQKHPFIGNGFDERTRYSDHRYLFVGAHGDVIGSGNSFSHYWASMGIFFIIGFFILLWKAVVPQGKLYALLILAVVILNLQGEQWFNFPLYLGLIFMVVPESSKAKLAYYIKTS
jgi:hypothetical protein